MKWSADSKDIATASRVSEFMFQLSKDQRERWNNVKPQVMPFGDLAYGSALMKWYEDGCPKQAFFSYEETQSPCPYLMEFRKEISEEFGLRILTAEEAKEENKKHTTVVTHKVHDWGLN